MFAVCIVVAQVVDNMSLSQEDLMIFEMRYTVRFKGVLKNNPKGYVCDLLVSLHHSCSA